MNAVIQYPLLFGFQEQIVGQGFLAGIDVRGRALAAQEEDGEWWIYGVKPGALAESGSDIPEAMRSFRQAFRTVLVDFAEEEADFDGFRARVETFFRETDSETDSDWEKAREEVRAGNISLGELPKVAQVTTPVINVQKLELAPTVNRIDNEPEPSSIAA